MQIKLIPVAAAAAITAVAHGAYTKHAGEQAMFSKVSDALTRASDNWSQYQQSLHTVHTDLAKNTVHDSRSMQSVLASLGAAVDGSNSALWQVSEACNLGCLLCLSCCGGGGSGYGNGNGNGFGWHGGEEGGGGYGPGTDKTGMGGGGVTEPPSTDKNGQNYPPGYPPPDSSDAPGQRRRHRYFFPMVGRLFPMHIHRGQMRHVASRLSQQLQPVVSSITTNLNQLAHRIGGEKYDDKRVLESQANALLRSVDLFSQNTNQLGLDQQRQAMHAASDKLRQALAH